MIAAGFLRVSKGTRCRSMECGFTLIEVIVAIVLFFLIMLYGSSAYMLGGKSMLRAKEEKIALQYARNKVEWSKLKCVMTTAYYNNGAPGTVSDNTSYTDNTTGIQYNVAWVSSDVPSGGLGYPGNRMKYVDVTVNWSSKADNIPRTLNMRTIVAPSFI